MHTHYNRYQGTRIKVSKQNVGATCIGEVGSRSELGRMIHL
jgi:hypothetical protein